MAGSFRYGKFVGLCFANRAMAIIKRILTLVAIGRFLGIGNFSNSSCRQRMSHGVHRMGHRSEGFVLVGRWEMSAEVAEGVFVDGTDRVSLAGTSRSSGGDEVSLSGNFVRDVLSSIPLMAADVAAVGTAWLVCKTIVVLLFGNTIAPGLGALISISVVYPVMLCTHGLYPGLLVSPAEELQRIFSAALMASLGFVVASFVYRDFEIFHVPIRILNFLLLVGCGMVARMAVREVLRNVPWWKQEVLVVGDRSDCQIVRAWLEKNGQLGLAAVDRVSVISGNAILATLSRRDGERISRFRNMWHVEYFGSHPHVTRFQKNFLLSPIHVISKRMFDIVVIVMASPVVVPTMLVLAGLVKLSSRGPVFYSQVRTGKKGRTFKAWKFRSMVPNADQVLKKCLAEDPLLQSEWEKDHKLKNDPRVTGVGKLMRKTSLDELPQLFNVLRGEMSLVGPRPIVDQEIGKYAQRYVCYQSVAPGITGLWQINGRNNTTYDERTAFDEDYACNWSVWFDIYILICTVKTVLRCEGAY